MRYQLPRRHYLLHLYWNFEWNTISVYRWVTMKTTPTAKAKADGRRGDGDGADMRLTECTLRIYSRHNWRTAHSHTHRDSIHGHYNCFHFPLQLIGNRIRFSLRCARKRNGLHTKSASSRRQRFSFRFHLTSIVLDISFSKRISPPSNWSPFFH